MRESGMPDETMWGGFFDLEAICARSTSMPAWATWLSSAVVAVPSPSLVSGMVFALDIEPEMTTLVQEKCRRAGIVNVQAVVWDFVAQGSHLPNGSMDAAMPFNILHHDEPAALMREAWRVLKPVLTI